MLLLERKLDNKLADPQRYSPKEYREKKLKEHLKED